ncbi:MAG TPA: choice-of-anchor R domain-containing protein, partial [Tepidisphaeraceae bacterium]|nr:choice-of-anchor R domain-containing protein [Tepidisphaeraceae bacterium]
MHSNLKKCVGLAIALVGFCFASKAQADVITSNLSQTAGPTNGVSGDPGWLGQKFFTGPSAMYLDGIRARTFFGGNMFIGIFSDSSGVPGTQLGLFDINPPLINGTANVFPYTGPQMLLAANTPYWIV